MKVSVKASVRAAAQMLGVADGVEGYLEGEQTEEGKKDAELLLDCFNRVENELALDYLPLVAEDELISSTGVVAYAELAYPVARILRVEDGDGNSLRYKLFPDRLEMQSGALKIVYAYSPNRKEMDGESDYQTGVSERLFVYGMAAEYSLAVGEFEAASVWDRKYKETIAAAYKARPVKRIRSRRWL